MEINDLSWINSLSKRFSNSLLPKSIRGLIVGKSGCGKTTLLLNLLLRPGWLDFNNLPVFGKSLFQESIRRKITIGLFGCQGKIMRLNSSPTSVDEEMAKDARNASDMNCKCF